jgi:hypothetical protein
VLVLEDSFFNLDFGDKVVVSTFLLVLGRTMGAFFTSPGKEGGDAAENAFAREFNEGLEVCSIENEGGLKNLHVVPSFDVCAIDEVAENDDGSEVGEKLSR